MLGSWSLIKWQLYATVGQWPLRLRLDPESGFSESSSSERPLVMMNQLVAISAHRLQVLDPMGPSMRTVLAMMNFETFARPAPRAKPAVLLHGFAAIQHVNALHQSPHRKKIRSPNCFHHELVALKRAHHE